MLRFLLTAILASVPINAQNSPAEPPRLQLQPGMHFVCFLGLGNQIWMVLSHLTPKGTEYILINPEGVIALVIFEPFDKV